MRHVLAFFLLAAASLVFGAEPVRPFSQTLTAEQKQRLGLAGLTPAQLADLDTVVGAYTRGETAVAVTQAVQQVEQKTEAQVQQAEKKAAVAAETAVAEYKKKQEPGLVTRALDAFKGKPEDDKREHFTARVVGDFRGWHGGTYFPLDNGQVWRQSGSESNVVPVVKNAEVEIYRSGNGYWRLKYAGAWITVKRLQ